MSSEISTGGITLPRKYQGNPIPVADFSDDERVRYRLSTPNTVVEVFNDNDLITAIDHAFKVGYTGWDQESGNGDGRAGGGLDPWQDYIKLIQIGDYNVQYLIWWELIRNKDLFRDLLASDEVTKIGVNLGFDVRFQMADRVKEKKKFDLLNMPIKRLLDAQINEQVLLCGLTGDIGQTMGMTGMAAMIERWTGLVIPKDDEIRIGWERMEPGNWDTYKDGESIPGGIKKMLYAADDVIHPITLVKIQKPWVKELNLERTVQLESRTIPTTAAMEVRGMAFLWDSPNPDQITWSKLSKEAEDDKEKAMERLDDLFDVKLTIYEDVNGNKEIERDKNYGSTDELKNLIHDYMKSKYGVTVIANNKHFYDALLDSGINKKRLDSLFEQKKVKDPETGRNKTVGSPDKDDILKELWGEYKEHLPPEAFYLEDTESGTLELMRILWETDASLIDSRMPTKVGLCSDLVNALSDYKDAKTRLERYAWSWKDLINPITGRVHTGFTQAMADTGRYTSSPNFQNLPGLQKYRGCFVAKPGYKIVGADWAQIEPRIIAQISKDPVYMRTFCSGHPGTALFDFWCDASVTEKLDLYVEVGKQIGLIPKHYTVADCKGDEKRGIEAKKDGKEGRGQSKIAVLGLGYGQGPEKFWIKVIIDTGKYHTREETDSLFFGFWEAVEPVKVTLNELSDIASKKSHRKVNHPFVLNRSGDFIPLAYSESLGGRKRFFEPKSKAWWTQGRNHPIQSTGADILKETLVYMYWWLISNNIPGGIVLVIHDEILVEVKEEYAESVKEKLSYFMSKVGQRYCPNVPIDADAYIADCWTKD